MQSFAWEEAWTLKNLNENCFCDWSVSWRHGDWGVVPAEVRRVGWVIVKGKGSPGRVSLKDGAGRGNGRIDLSNEDI